MASEVVGLKAVAIAVRAREAIDGAAATAFARAKKLLASRNWEERFFAVLVFGGLAATQARARRALLERCVHDDDWAGERGTCQGV